MKRALKYRSVLVLLLCSACEIRGTAGEISFEKDCYSIVAGASVTINGQIRDETGAGTDSVKVSWTVLPDREGLMISGEVTTPSTKEVNSFMVDGVASIDVTVMPTTSPDREYSFILQTVEDKIVSASTILRVQLSTENDECVPK